MEAPPRRPDSPLLDPASLRFILASGAFKAGLAGLLLLALPPWGASFEATRTAVFLYTALGQLVFAYPARRLGLRPLPNPVLHLSIVACAALTAGALFVPGLRAALGLVPIDAGLWLAVLGAVAVTWLAAEALGRWLARR
jgi:Ca2+-transporting ATPase